MVTLLGTKCVEGEHEYSTVLPTVSPDITADVLAMYGGVEQTAAKRN
jgi:hypothetical protein